MIHSAHTFPSLHIFHKFTLHSSNLWPFSKEANVFLWLFPLTVSLCSSKFNPIPLPHLSPISNATYFIEYSVDHISFQTRSPWSFPYHQIIYTFLNFQFISSVSHLVVFVVFGCCLFVFCFTLCFDYLFT